MRKPASTAKSNALTIFVKPIRIHHSSSKPRAMKSVSVEQFRATLKIIVDEQEAPGEAIYSYWNNQLASSTCCNTEEVLHITRSSDGLFYLEIGNLVHTASLATLEVKLYEWARDEGWLDELF